MINWRESDILANGIRLHVYRAGAGKQPVVLAHGGTDNALCWPLVAEALATDYDLISYDARCHGLSEAPREEPTWQEMAADLAALVDTLGLDKPFALGHSMGALTVALAAATYPGILGKAAIEDPPMGMPPHDPDRMAAGRQAMCDGLAAQHAMTVDEIVAAGRAQKIDWPDEVMRPWALAKKQVTLSQFALVSSTPDDWREICRAITCPTLLIWGDNDKGSIIGEAAAHEMVALMANGQDAHFATGHCIRRDAPEAYISAVKAFFAS